MKMIISMLITVTVKQIQCTNNFMMTLLHSRFQAHSFISEWT